MINNSGIGTYIKNLLPLIIEKTDDCFFYLLGDKETITKYIGNRLSFKYSIIKFDAPIFSIKEQIGYINNIPKDVDILWIPNFNIPWVYRKNLLVTIHDVFHLAMSDLVGGSVKYYYAKMLFNLVKYNNKAILTVSNFSKNEINTRLKIENDKINVIPLGVNRYWFEDCVYKEKKNSRPYVLFVGNVKPNKNLYRLVKAFLLIKDEVEFDLVVVGKKDGFITPDNEVYDECFKFGTRIFFTGYITEERLKEYYHNALMFIFPSIYEGFGLPILEALACKCPVIASNRASLPEVGQEFVVYCNPESIEDIADKMLKLYNNESLREKLSLEGYNYAQNFNWEVCAMKTIDVIKKCLK